MVVRLKGGFGLRIVQQDRRRGRVARPGLRLRGGIGFEFRFQCGVLGCQGCPGFLEVFDSLDFAVCYEGGDGMRTISRKKDRDGIESWGMEILITYATQWVVIV
jgi:hypothetical protein